MPICLICYTFIDINCSSRFCNSCIYEYTQKQQQLTQIKKYYSILTTILEKNDGNHIDSDLMNIVNIILYFENKNQID